MDAREIIHFLPTYTQAICSGALLYFSDAKAVVTQERKNLIVSDIKLLKKNIEELEKALV